MRRRFGGRLHARNDGIKPFIQSVRQGYWGLLPAGPGSRPGREDSLISLRHIQSDATCDWSADEVLPRGDTAFPVAQW